MTEDLNAEAAAQAQALSESGTQPVSISYHVNVNWGTDGSQLSTELTDFRVRHPLVTFNAQWPAVIISSPSISAIQSAVREFAIGPLEDLDSLQERWKWNQRTGEILIASFDWIARSGPRGSVDVAFEN
jgi:hypothetical protein